VARTILLIVEAEYIDFVVINVATEKDFGDEFHE
jgi:hypothetical protein